MADGFDLLGGLISAGASIFNGAQNRASAQQINDQNTQANFNYATHSVDWKAGDAVQAEKDFGINRLVGMGVQPSAPPPVAVNVSDNSTAAAGQDIGRAVAAMSPLKVRNAELENQLLEAKIRGLDAETTAQQASTSERVTKLGQPGTGPAIPLPTADPRGPVYNLVSRARDWRSGQIVDIPDPKMASSLQTLAALPTNAALAGRGAYNMLGGDTGEATNNSPGFFAPLTGAVSRALSSDQYSPYLSQSAP